MKTINQQIARLAIRKRWTRSASLFAFAVAILSLTATTSRAGFVAGAYTVSVGESERVLAAEIDLARGLIDAMQFNSIVFQESCMNPSIRTQLRNRFAMSVINDETSQGDITSVTIDLTDMGFAFGTGDTATDGFNGNFFKNTIYFDDGDGINDNGVDVSITGVTFPDPVDPSEMQINFNGLTPGKAIIFRLDLDTNPDMGGSTPDYRHALYGVNVGGSGTTTPATFTARFTMEDDEEIMSTDSPVVPFSHNFTPEELAALAIMPQTEPYHSQSMSEMFGQTGRTVIPEPSTACLLLAGLAALCGRRLRPCLPALG